MSLVKIGERHQITIPKDVFNQFHLKKGDVVEVVPKGNTIVLVPSKVIPKDESWFHTKEWQEKEMIADKEFANGEYEEFDNADDLLKDLKS